jgi:hypothetical protein
MTLSELANIGEALGGLAILVSLIYIALEVRRNTRAARSAARLSAGTAMFELNIGIAHNRELSALLLRASKENTRPEDLTDEEFSQYFFACRGWNCFSESQWNLWKDGTISDEMWQPTREYMHNQNSHPIGGFVWAIEKHLNTYSADFIESIDSYPATRHVT